MGKHELLARIAEEEARLAALVGTQRRDSQTTGGFADDARLDTLFLAMTISKKGTITQNAGCLHRLHAKKKEVRVFDYVDRDVPLLMRMFEKRLRTYRAIGYARGEAPLGFSESVEEYTVEYDEEALHHFDHAM